MVLIYDPVATSKTEYLWHSHERPWRISSGKIDDLKFIDNKIVLTFSLSRQEAVKNPRWSFERSGVVLELLDVDNRTVFEFWVDFKGKDKIRKTIRYDEI